MSKSTETKIEIACMKSSKKKLDAWSIILGRYDRVMKDQVLQITTRGNVKIGPTTSSIQGLYRYGIAGRAASQSLLGMGGRGIGVRGVPGANPGEPPLLMVALANEIGE